MANSPLPYATADLPGVGGTLRARDEDFVVEEIPAYSPSGEGSHVFAWIEKRGRTTAEVATAMAEALGVSPRDVGAAGMKDKRAVTRQYLSLPAPATAEAVRSLEIPGVTVLSVTPHENKLRTGHLQGNRFTLIVRDLEIDVDEAAARARNVLSRLAASPGCPNWYGAQRFGMRGDNAAAGKRLVASRERGRGPRGRQRRLLISAYQSQLFNDYLRLRLEDDLFATVIAGDLLQRRESGGVFACADVPLDQGRFDDGELAITGPMFGSRMKAPAEGSEPAAREAALLAREELAATDFSHLGKLALGTRRPLGVLAGDPEVSLAEDGTLSVSFALPAGSYATAVMREVIKGPTDFPG